MANETILVIDDEKDIVELISYNLQKNGWQVLGAETGEAGLALARDKQPDLIVLDLMLPGIDGLEVCRRLRQDDLTTTIPIIMVTAKDSETDVVVGLEFGADDYIAKPFSPRVLIARVKACLRRQQREGDADDSRGDATIIRRDRLTIDPGRHEVRLEDQIVVLTITEFRILSLLAKHPGRVFTRSQIIDGIHDDLYAVTDRAVDVQIVGLRRKLGDYSTHSYIETIRGVGYRFRE
jgi:two-component system phosphate regulon response regulator PhoB